MKKKYNNELIIRIGLYKYGLNKNILFLKCKKSRKNECNLSCYISEFSLEFFM